MEERRPTIRRVLERRDGIAGPSPVSSACGVPHTGKTAVTVEFKA
jgi:hypothetical protein